MRKVALVFVLAVFVPSLVLAWLAVRSLRDQQFVLERQQSLLYQGVTDSFAQEINNYLAYQQREFNAQVESLMAGADPRGIAPGFDDRLRANWPMAEVGFCVTLSGSLLCPSPTSRPETRIFCVNNGGFLANREIAEVYWNTYTANLKGVNPLDAGNLLQTVNPIPSPQLKLNPAAPQGELNNDQAASERNLYSSKTQSRKVNPAQQQAVPLPNEAPADVQNISKVVSAEAEFRQLIGDASDGMMARFLQNKLKLMFWHRLERDPQLVFGAQLSLDQITETVRLMVQSKFNSAKSINMHSGVSVNRIASPFPEWTKSAPFLPDEVCLVVLDNNTKPVAASDFRLNALAESGIRLKEPIEASFRNALRTDLKRPFVATEIGEALPHWEVAAYLRNPDKLKQSARTLQLTLGLLVAVLVLAIGVGSWLIVADVNRQLRLTRQKTDFVSNVSHELKTPLTSIRMFSELLADGKVADAAKQRSYLQIIAAESARLTRLINNVLDFARMDRGEKKYNFQACDLAPLLKETVETYRPHLESNGFTLEFQPPQEPILLRADRDAVSQVVVNLLSNAEKYSNGAKEISVVARLQTGPVRHVEIQVLDRGPGVPRGCEERIFEQFYRAHDSLSSGVQGSGLGLTLARQIARAHGGDVVYRPREGGGSCFVLTLPVSSA